MLRGSVGALLLFTDDSGGLWRSDGTRAGTFALAAHAEGVAVLAQTALFLVRASDAGPLQVWATDGTAAGTRALVDPFDTGTVQPSSWSTFQGFASGGKVFWVLSDSPDSELLVSDGTRSGSRALLVLPESDSPRLFTAAAGRLFFLATRAQGEQLWTSDGTAAGTRQITHFVAPVPFPATATLKAVATGVDFAADDGVHGLNVWRSNGTAAGTVRITALATPFVPQIEEIGGRILAVALDATSVYRLFASSGAPASTISLGALEVSPYAGLATLDRAP